MIRLKVNRKECAVDGPPHMPLLWVVRATLGLTGTKFGCGMAQCGACTVHLEGDAVRPCVTPVSRAAEKEVVTIEGLADELRHPLQQAWIDEDVPQCGYCQSGQIMRCGRVAQGEPQSHRHRHRRLHDRQHCRCGTYFRIRLAIHRAARTAQKGVPDERSVQSRPAPISLDRCTRWWRARSGDYCRNSPRRRSQQQRRPRRSSPMRLSESVPTSRSRSSPIIPKWGRGSTPAWR